MERRHQRVMTAQSHHRCPNKVTNKISFPVSLNRSIDFSQLKYHLVVLKQTPGIFGAVFCSASLSQDVMEIKDVANSSKGLEKFTAASKQRYMESS